MAHRSEMDKTNVVLTEQQLIASAGVQLLSSTRELLTKHTPDRRFLQLTLANERTLPPTQQTGASTLPSLLVLCDEHSQAYIFGLLSDGAPLPGSEYDALQMISYSLL